MAQVTTGARPRPVYARPREDGASRVYWLTHETNTVAMQLSNKVADKSGFVQYRKIL